MYLRNRKACKVSLITPSLSSTVFALEQRGHNRRFADDTPMASRGTQHRLSFLPGLSLHGIVQGGRAILRNPLVH